MSHETLENTSNIIIPFPIYHFVDTNTNTYHGYIGYPTKTLTMDGKIVWRPDQLDNKRYGPWFLYDVFYAFSPMIRPIPNRLKLYEATKSGEFPYDTKSVNYVRDPFDLDNNAVYFITWNQPMPNTVPLYIHKTNDGCIFPSYDKDPPEETAVIGSPKWDNDIISPIFVMRKPIYNYLPIQGSCLPTLSTSGMSFERCFLTTDKNIFKDQNSARTLLQQLDIDNKSNSLTENMRTKKKSKYIKLLIIIPIFVISLLIIIFSRKNNTKIN
jgi:hypothetical protein